MNSQWREQLLALGAKPATDDDGSLRFDAPADIADAVCPLLSETVLHVSGDDAESYLQAQFSNDVATLALPGSQINTWSTAKGRVLMVFRLLKVAEGYLIKMPTELVEPVLKRLRMFVLMAKVVIEPREEWVTVGVSGKCATALAEVCNDLPSQVNEVVALNDSCWIACCRGEAPRYEIIGDAASVGELISSLVKDGQMANADAWRLQNIDAGVPSVFASTSESFVLQMLNLHRIDGVSFKKGCFPGQEVVARMHYLGKLKRQMYRLESQAGDAPVAGGSVYKAGGSAVGEIVDAVQTDNGARMLAVMKIDALYLSFRMQLQRKKSKYCVSLKTHQALH